MIYYFTEPRHFFFFIEPTAQANDVFDIKEMRERISQEGSHASLPPERSSPARGSAEAEPEHSLLSLTLLSEPHQLCNDRDTLHYMVHVLYLGPQEVR